MVTDRATAQERPSNIKQITPRAVVWKQRNGERAVLIATVKPRNDAELACWKQLVGADDPVWGLESVNEAPGGQFTLVSPAKNVVNLATYMRSHGDKAAVRQLFERGEAARGALVDAGACGPHELVLAASGDVLISAIPWLQVPSIDRAATAEVRGAAREPLWPEHAEEHVPARKEEAAAETPKADSLEQLPITAPTPITVKSRLRLYPLLVTTILSATTILGWAGWRLGNGPDLTDTCPSTEKARVVVGDLLAKRAAAFNRGVPESDLAYAVGQALQHDKNMLNQMASKEETVRHVEFEVGALGEVTCERDAWSAPVTVNQGAYERCVRGHCEAVESGVIPLHLVVTMGGPSPQIAKISPSDT